jgi:hypothetical protein
MAIGFILGVAAAGLCAPARASVLADSVNASLAADNDAFWGVDDVGWLYTPTSGYNLIGINTFFSIPVGTSIENRPVTVAVYQNNTPTNGGTLLGSFSFDSSLAEGQLGGGSFSSPIALTGGQQYFVGFENVGPMSSTPNVDDLGVNFTGDPSATSLSSTFLDVAGNPTCPNPDTFACVDPNPDFLSQPILQFFAQTTSATPEPGSGALLGGALALALGYALRSKRLSLMKP